MIIFLVVPLHHSHMTTLLLQLNMIYQIVWFMCLLTLRDPDTQQLFHFGICQQTVFLNTHKTCSNIIVLLGFAFIPNLENKTSHFKPGFDTEKCSVLLGRREQNPLGLAAGAKRDCCSSLKFIKPIARVLDMLNSQLFYSLFIFKDQLK